MGKSVRIRQRNCDYMKKTKARVQLIRYTECMVVLIISSRRPVADACAQGMSKCF
jgi:uncharacterized protein (DUF2062 family)